MRRQGRAEVRRALVLALRLHGRLGCAVPVAEILTEIGEAVLDKQYGIFNVRLPGGLVRTAPLHVRLKHER